MHRNTDQVSYNNKEGAEEELSASQTNETRHPLDCFREGRGALDDLEDRKDLQEIGAHHSEAVEKLHEYCYRVAVQVFENDVL